MESDRIEIIDLGRMAYAEALARQIRRVERMKSDAEAPEALLLVEHDPPVFTLGRGADRSNILVEGEWLTRRGIEVIETNRGGDVTYHGPGQLVGYPILRLDRRGRDVHQHLRNLEETVLRVLRHYGLSGERIPGKTGVWIESRKIAAVGVAVSRWIAYHGFSFNVATNPEHFEAIVPCGIRDRTVTDLCAEVKRPVSTDEVKPLVIECFEAVFAGR